MTNKTDFPLNELINKGILWYINRVAFHPRGYALSLTKDNDSILGWNIIGDGTSIFAMSEEQDDNRFVDFENFLKEITKRNKTR